MGIISFANGLYENDEAQNFKTMILVWPKNGKIVQIENVLKNAIFFQQV